LRVRIYLCSFRKARQVVSRHYVSHVSLCREVGVEELPLDALGRERVGELMRYGEAPRGSPCPSRSP